MDGSLLLLVRSDSSLALRCRKGAIHPIIQWRLGAALQRPGPKLRLARKYLVENPHLACNGLSSIKWAPPA